MTLAPPPQLTLLSLSKRQAKTLLAAVAPLAVKLLPGTPLPGATGAGIGLADVVSPSREAALTLGGVNEAAAQPMATPPAPRGGPEGTVGPDWEGRWTWTGITAAVGRS